MFSMTRRRISFAGLIATLALVLAMSGGAWAAKKYLITSPKQIKPSVLKKLKGKRGPAGPAGEAGAQGAQGLPGAAGANGFDGAPGTNGTNGKDGAAGEDGKNIVTGTELPSVNCEEGGFWGEVAGSGEKKYACNGLEGGEGEKGDKGDPWTAGGTLPAEATLTGAWSIAQSEGANFVAISFLIPLKDPLAFAKTKVNDGAKGTGDLTSGSSTVANLTTTSGKFTVGAPISGTGIPAGTTIVSTTPTTLTLSQAATATGTGVALTEGVFADCDDDVAPAPGHANPEADPGFLCVYNAGGFAGGAITNINSPSGPAGAGTTGAILSFSGGNQFAWGTWAVTAP